jgi:type II secretory pathway component PulM
MKASPSLSDTFRRLNPRERRVVAGGAIVSAIALLVVGVVMPFVHHWSEREAAYAASYAQWVKLDGLVANQGRLERAVGGMERASAADTARLVNGDTPALAASTLQGLVQQYANASGVQVERIDVAGEAKPDKPGLLAIPVQLQARGDVYGLVQFLERVQEGDKLLVVDELTLDSGLETDLGEMQAASYGGATARAAPLSWTLRLHGLYEGSAVGESAALSAPITSSPVISAPVTTAPVTTAPVSPGGAPPHLTVPSRTRMAAP